MISPGFVPRLVGWVSLLTSAGALAGAAWLGFQMYEAAPPVKFVERLAIPKSSVPDVIGWKELGQHPGPRSASTRHLRISFDGGKWTFANVSGNRRVLVKTDKIEARFLHRWPLQKGDKIAFVKTELEVMELTETRLVFRETKTNRRVAWNDGELQADNEKVYKVCQGLGRRVIQRARWTFRTFDAEARPELQLFSIGGNVNCTDRWQIKELPPESVAVTWHAGKFWLKPGAKRFDVLMSRFNSKKPVTFADLTFPLNGPEGTIKSMILGRTSYELTPKGNELIFRPLANLELWLDDENPPGAYTSAKWIGAGKPLVPWLKAQGIWLLPGFVAMVLTVVGLSWYWSRRQYITPLWLAQSIAALAPALLGGWLTLLIYRGAGDPDKILLIGMVWVAWAWATVVLFWTGRLRGFAGLIWTCAIILAGIGTLNLLQLGAGAENTKWLSYVQKHGVLLALFGWTVSMLCVLRDGTWRKFWLWVFNTEAVAAGIAVVLVFMMFLQLAIGSEEGIGGLQPVELTKSVFVLLLAYVGMHFTEIRMREVQAYKKSPIRFLWPFLRLLGLFALIVFGVVLGVRDFSPAVIMGLVGIAWLWKLGAAPPERTNSGIWLAIRPAVLVLIAGVIAAGWYAHENPDKLPEGTPQKDRIQVWAQPELHPHSGSQVLGGMDRVREGGWDGALEWFGRNGVVMNLPAVQDDFITAFYLYRFGGLSGIVLMAVQLFYLVLIFTLGRRFARVAAEGDFREQQGGLVISYLLYGLAFMQIAHWMIAWSNTLGLLPVMGQPMTWLSAGNSHLLGFALFTLTMAMISSWVLNTYTDEEEA